MREKPNRASLRHGTRVALVAMENDLIPPSPPYELTHTYFVVGTSQAQGESKAACSAAGAALASIRSSQQQTLAYTAVQASGAAGWVWLGFERIGPKWTLWTRPDGSPLYHASSPTTVLINTFTNWGYEPAGRPESIRAARRERRTWRDSHS